MTPIFIVLFPIVFAQLEAPIENTTEATDQHDASCNLVSEHQHPHPNKGKSNLSNSPNIDFDQIINTFELLFSWGYTAYERLLPYMTSFEELLGQEAREEMQQEEFSGDEQLPTNATVSQYLHDMMKEMGGPFEVMASDASLSRKVQRWASFFIEKGFKVMLKHFNLRGLAGGATHYLFRALTGEIDSALLYLAKFGHGATMVLTFLFVGIIMKGGFDVITLLLSLAELFL